jgi:hypothetical protein
MPKKKSTADKIKDAISAVGMKVRREAEDFASTAVESFKRNYKRRAARRKPAARAKMKQTAGAARKVVKKAVARKAKTSTTRGATKTRTPTKSVAPASKAAPKSRRKKSA